MWHSNDGISKCPRLLWTIPVAQLTQQTPIAHTVGLKMARMIRKLVFDVRWCTCTATISSNTSPLMRNVTEKDPKIPANEISIADAGTQIRRANAQATRTSATS